MTWKHTRHETYQKFVENIQNKVSGERLHHLNQADWSYCCHMVPWWNIDKNHFFKGVYKINFL